jgi:hypothetical protein
MRNHRLVSFVTPLTFIFVCAWVGLISPMQVFSQYQFYVNNYRKTDYKASNQNWDIDINSEGDVFVANHKGLLRISGSNIDLFELPAKTIIRSVACIGDKVYTGSFEDFGYWTTTQNGGLHYHSLKSLLHDDVMENDEFWKIVSHKDGIYFQSFGKLLFYDYQQIISIPIDDPILFLFKCTNRLFTQRINGGIYEIIDNELVVLEGSEVFSKTEVKAILPFGDQQIVIGTSSEGLFVYDGQQIIPWPNDANELLIESKINNGIILGELMAFGTITKGLVIVDSSGSIIHHLHLETSLQNNTVLCLRSDLNNNLWAGLDKGIDYIEFDTPFSFYNKNDSPGAVYAAAFFDNELYVGTNQGVYIYSSTSSGVYGNPVFVQGTQGQVWFLKEIDGYLYCGLNNGTFIIHNDSIEKVGFVDGGYNLKKISIAGHDHLIQSTYNEIVVFSQMDGIWRQHLTIAGFSAPVRFMEIDHSGRIWLGHTISGLFMVQPNSAYDSAEMISRITSEYAPGLNLNKVFKVDNRIVVAGGDNLLQWDAINQQLVPFYEIANQLEGFQTSTRIIPANANRYWFVNNNEIALFEIRFDKVNLLYRIIPEKYGLQLVEDYENIITLSDSTFLICLENGFSILNLNQLDRLPENSQPPIISRVDLWKSPEKMIQVSVSSLKRPELKDVMDNVVFFFTAAGTTGKKQYYQFRLVGFENEWSNWTDSDKATYERLPHGSYDFQVRTLTAKGFLTPAAHFRLTIKPPWHFTYYAYTFYVIVFLVLLLMIRIYYLRRKWKRRELLMKQEQEEIKRLKEQAEKQVIALNNEKLQSELDHINIQLANNTMAIIEKNELLLEIREELHRQKEELGYRVPAKYYQKIDKLIEKGITSDHDWEIFEKLFDKAHHDFFQRLKNDYPEITTNDLRLCAYLRLNLTSKEIAPLLNITVRGVEERRYRIRKRLQLSSDQNLTEFILSY